MKWIKYLLDDPEMIFVVFCFVLLMFGIACATGDLEKIVKWIMG